MDLRVGPVHWENLAGGWVKVNMGSACNTKEKKCNNWLLDLRFSYECFLDFAIILMQKCGVLHLVYLLLISQDLSK